VPLLPRSGSRAGTLGTVAHSDPEAAARADIPAKFARTLAVAVAPDGEYAVVLLGTNEPPYLYPYQVICRRSRDGWEEEASGNGPGWTSVRGGDVGIETEWGEAPEGSSAVAVQHGAQRHRVAVTNGYFLFVAWNVSAVSPWDDEEAPGTDASRW
jgi:hypothetical protein